MIGFAMLSSIVTVAEKLLSGLPTSITAQPTD